jgi:hypothetical protein
MERTRTHPAIVRYGLYLYFSSRSFRLAAKSLVPIKKRSHVSLWKWVQRYSDHAADRFRTEDRFRTDNKRLVKEILFVDETLLHIGGKSYWLWIDHHEPNLNVFCLILRHLSREGRFSSYVINSSSSNKEVDMVGNQFSQTVLIGTMKPANG